MKKIFYIAVALASPFVFAACNSGDVIDEAWFNANTSFYNEIKTDGEYREFETQTGPSGVYYKDLTPLHNKELGEEFPIETSQVKVYYRGYYCDFTVNGDTTFFDKGSFSNNKPTTFNTNSTVRGFAFALQNMRVGERKEIVIPYWLGYGESGYIDTNYYSSTYGSTIIKGYSMLLFDIELVEIIQYP